MPAPYGSKTPSGLPKKPEKRIFRKSLGTVGFPKHRSSVFTRSGPRAEIKADRFLGVRLIEHQTRACGPKAAHSGCLLEGLLLGAERLYVAVPSKPLRALSLQQ